MASPPIMLSEHFSLLEMTRTDVRAYQESNAHPPAEVKAALAALCTTLLEPLRAHFGAPVVVHSGYRSRALNSVIGGAVHSQHIRGEAADFHVIGVDLEKVFHWIWQDSGLQFGQTILEGWAAGHPTWLHLSLERGNPELDGQVLTFSEGRYRRLA